MTKSNGDKATLREVYDLVEKRTVEINATILRLENKFDTLEQGRLTMLERDFANLQGKMAVVAGVISLVIGLIFVGIQIYFKK